MSLCLVTMRRPRRQMCEHTRSTIVQLFNKFWDFSDCMSPLTFQRSRSFALPATSVVFCLEFLFRGALVSLSRPRQTAVLTQRLRHFSSKSNVAAKAESFRSIFQNSPEPSFKEKKHTRIRWSTSSLQVEVTSPDPNFRLTFCHHCIPCRSYWKCLAHQLKTRICHRGANWKMSELKVAR